MKERTGQSTRTDGELTPLDSTHLATARVPTRVRIAPWGEVDSTSGRFVVDEESARLVVEAFKRHETDLPIDYESAAIFTQININIGRDICNQEQRPAWNEGDFFGRAFN